MFQFIEERRQTDRKEIIRRQSLLNMSILNFIICAPQMMKTFSYLVKCNSQIQFTLKFGFISEMKFYVQNELLALAH
jgi:hypothetical protein